MAVHRPNFSKVQKRPATTKRKPSRKKVSPRREEVEKKSSFPRLLMLFIAFAFVLFDTPPRRAAAKTLRARFLAQQEASPAETTLFGDVGLTNEQMRKVAVNILSVAKGMRDEYEVADGLVLTSYILRYFAEIGEYEIAYQDLMILVNAFEKMTGRVVEPEVRDILDQISKIRFGRRDGRYYSKFFAKNPLKGIIIPIEEVSEDPESSLKEIRFVLIKDGAEMTFEEVDTVAEKDAVRKFIKTPIKLLGIIDGVVDALNQVTKPITQSIDAYLEDPTQSVPPLIIGMNGVSVEVATSTVFKDIVFDFKEAYALPNIENEEQALPSFVLGAKAKLLKLKVSIDQ